MTESMKKDPSNKFLQCRRCSWIYISLLVVSLLIAPGCRSGFLANQGSSGVKVGAQTTPRTLTEERMNRREMVAQDIKVKTAWARSLFYDSRGAASMPAADAGTSAPE